MINFNRVIRHYIDESPENPAYVEIHRTRGNGKVTAFVFHAGEFSLPLLRSRPYQRVQDRVEHNPLRPWVMGRVTYKRKILLENPGVPGIVFKDCNAPLAGNSKLKGHGFRDNSLSVSVWIDGSRMNLEDLSREEMYTYKEIEVNAALLLEQKYQAAGMSVMTAIVLTRGGPVQHAVIENGDESRTRRDIRFISMFPNNMTEYYAFNNSGSLCNGDLNHSGKGRDISTVSVRGAQWLAVYDPNNRLGTVVYSPDFKQMSRSHLLTVDRMQDFRIYHETEAVHTDRLNHAHQTFLAAGPIEADPGSWRTRAEEAAIILSEGEGNGA